MENETTNQRSRLGAPLQHLKAEGTGPALLDAVTGTIGVQSSRAAGFRAWTLDAVGQRLREIPLERDRNRVRLEMKVEYESVYYELSPE